MGIASCLSQGYTSTLVGGSIQTSAVQYRQVGRKVIQPFKVASIFPPTFTLMTTTMPLFVLWGSNWGSDTHTSMYQSISNVSRQFVPLASSLIDFHFAFPKR